MKEIFFKKSIKDLKYLIINKSIIRIKLILNIVIFLMILLCPTKKILNREITLGDKFYNILTRRQIQEQDNILNLDGLLMLKENY